MSSLILLHGMTGCAASWRRVREALPAPWQTQVHAVDLPGHGSAAALRPPSFRATLAALASQFSQWPAPRYLAGYSLGARLALGLWVEFPELAVAATLIGVQPGLDAAAAPLRAAADAQLADELEQKGREDFLERWQNLPLFASQRRLPSAVLAEQANLRAAQDPAGWAWALRVLSPGKMPDYRHHLGSLPGPLTWMVGGEDTKFLELAKSLLADRPRDPPSATHQLLVVPGCGHNLILEAPTQVAETLTAAAGPWLN